MIRGKTRQNVTSVGGSSHIQTSKMAGSKYKEHFEMTKTCATWKKCGKTYNIASGQRTGLKNHMKNKHDIVIPDEKKPTSSTSSAGSGSMDSFVKKEPKKPIEDLVGLD